MSAALRQLLEFGLFHGDPHPGNIFAMRDGRIAYVDFGNVAELSQVSCGLHESVIIDNFKFCNILFLHNSVIETHISIAVHILVNYIMLCIIVSLQQLLIFLILNVFQQNKQILIDAVVHAVNEDYSEMANDFTRLGFLAKGTDVSPIIPALEAIWQNSAGKGLADFNFRSVTGAKLLVFNYSLLICSISSNDNT